MLLVQLHPESTAAVLLPMFQGLLVCEQPRLRMPVHACAESSPNTQNLNCNFNGRGVWPREIAGAVGDSGKQKEHRMSAVARKRIGEAIRKRWAEKKKAAVKKK